MEFHYGLPLYHPCQTCFSVMQGWILEEVNEAVTSTPHFSEMLWPPSLRVLHLVFEFS